MDVLKEVKDYALDSPLPLFSAYDKFRAALEARISHRHLLVQVSEGDLPPEDTSEEEIEELNAWAVIIPIVDPVYGTYVQMWKHIRTYPMIAIETVWFSLGRARTSGFKSAMIVTDRTQSGLSGVVRVRKCSISRRFLSPARTSA